MFKIYVRGKEKLGKYYCMDCKKWFDVPVTEEVDEPRGEYWGMACTERVFYQYCPECGSADIEEAKHIELFDDEEEEL